MHYIASPCDVLWYVCVFSNCGKLLFFVEQAFILLSLMAPFSSETTWEISKKDAGGWCLWITFCKDYLPCILAWRHAPLAHFPTEWTCVNDDRWQPAVAFHPHWITNDVWFVKLLQSLLQNVFVLCGSKNNELI